MENTEKECPFCAEIIRINAIKCKHCGSTIENTQLKTFSNVEYSGASMTSQDEHSQDKRAVLVFTSTIIAFGGILIDTELVNLSSYQLMVTAILSLFLVYAHYIDRKFLPTEIKSKLPWYTNPVVTLITPFISIPLYFYNLKKYKVYNGNLFLITLPWVLSILSLVYSLTIELD